MVPSEQQPNATVNSLVNEALGRWLKLTGIAFDKNGNVTRKAKNCPWQGYTLGSLTEGLNESRDLDPTGLTTFMMLRGMVESYLRDIKFDAETLILSPGTIESQLVPMRAVRDVLESHEVVHLVEEFQQRIRDAALHYGVRPGKAMDDLEELLKDKYELAIVRRDALLSARRLHAHQFSQGPADPNPPKYSTSVYEFWNVNSLLVAMRAQKFGGISMVLIRDPVEALQSYFIFAMRNGLTFTILTDEEKGPHPAYKRMSRRPDRELERRAAKNWFPYDLLDVKEVDDGGRSRLVAEIRKQLVPVNVEAVPIKEVRDLAPEQFVWAVLMFDLIRDRFWHKNERLPELSYTGQMVVEPQALIGASSALVKDGMYKPLELPALTRKDVTDKTTKGQWESKPTAFNRWMVDRYGSRVPEELLNPVGAQAQLLLEAKTEDPSFLPIVGEESAIERRLRTEGKPTFETLSPVSFGVKADIQRDRVWVARVNQMKAVQAFADEEFAREKDEVVRWYQAALDANKEMLLNAAATGELKLPSWKTKAGGHFAGKELKERVEAISQRAGKDWGAAFTEYGFRRPTFGLGKRVADEVPSRGWRHRMRTIHYSVCAERPEVRASIFTNIQVTCPQALAVVCGVAVAELPWPLQHWFDDEPYTGNHILSRLDPEDWVLSNPWMPDVRRSTGLRLNVGVAHCKHAFNARRKALGLPAKSWAEKGKDDE